MPARFLSTAAFTLTVGLVAAGCTTASQNASVPPTSIPPVQPTPPTDPAQPFLTGLKTITQIGSTVPANGDLNPYGIAVVPTTTGKLVAGDTLVSNFNSKANVQGTGTTLVQVSPGGAPQLFANLSNLPVGMSCPGGVGLTTALGILPGGWVVVGSLPSTASGALPSGNPVGCLIVVNNQGTPTETITNPDVVAPWDLAVSVSGSTAELFVSNALGGNTSTQNGTPVTGNCTVSRIDLSLAQGSPPAVTSSTIIGTNFPWKADKNALVLSPTGLALGSNGTLYVDDTETNSISAIPQATTRTDSVTATADTVFSNGALNAPLGMTLAPDGDLIVVNGGDGNAVEITTAGHQVATAALVNNGAGDLFGVTIPPTGDRLLFVNDGTNAVESFTR